MSDSHVAIPRSASQGLRARGSQWQFVWMGQWHGMSCKLDVLDDLLGPTEIFISFITGLYRPLGQIKFLLRYEAIIKIRPIERQTAHERFRHHTLSPRSLSSVMHHNYTAVSSIKACRQISGQLVATAVFHVTCPRAIDQH